MDWNAIITALVWIAFVLSVGFITISLLYWNFVFTKFDRSIRTFNINKLYITAIISGIILYFG